MIAKLCMVLIFIGVAVGVGIDAEPVFDQREMTVILAEQLG